MSSQAQIDISISPANNQVFTYTNNSSVDSHYQRGFYLHGIGANGTSTNSDGVSAGNGLSSGGISDFTNNGSILVSPASTDITNLVAAVLVELLGGDGGNQTNGNGESSAGSGGSTGNITAKNTASVVIQGSYDGDVSIFEIRAIGGKGGDVTPKGTNSEGQPEFNGGLGGKGGSAALITMTNTGALTPQALQGAGEFYAIRAYSEGGKSGQGADGYPGGAGQRIIISNSGAISINSYSSRISQGNPPTAAYGILAELIGGDGSNSYTKSSDGKAGGNTSHFSINIIAPGDVLFNAGSNVTGSAVGGICQGGLGGDAYSGEEGRDSTGGHGGNAGNGDSTITVTDASINAYGDNIAGITGIHKGGNGGGGACDQQHSNGGLGGMSGAIAITVASTVDSISVSTMGQCAPAIVALSQAGIGGTAQLFNEALGGEAGNGGNGGSSNMTTVTLNAPLTNGTSFSGGIAVNTTGVTESPGIASISKGGDAGNGGELSSNTSGGGAGLAGVGGNGSVATVALYSGGAISTQGSSSFAILAQSAGGAGGAGGKLKDDFGGNAPDGGHGGDTGNVTITLFGLTSAVTAGEDSSVLVAQALSGSGGAGGVRGGGGGGSGGSGGQGGGTGDVNISNNGIVTSDGNNSHGLLAQNFSGAGGSGGYTSVVFYGSGGDGSAAGALGAIQLSNAGTITTNGIGSHGYLAQSSAGKCGTGGDSELGLASLGGSSSYSASGGAVYATNSGTISTTNSNSHGILLQSLGGGGGDGGSSVGIVTIGGDGGSGGTGGSITADLYQNHSVTTHGQQSIALIAQSIGGGGGNGGNAASSTTGATLVIGGSGGVAGSGGNVNMNSEGSVATYNSQSIGILGQSIGGGGGNGGAANVLVVSLGVSAAVALGGSGGAGGNGGTVVITIRGGEIRTGQFAEPTAATNMLPTDAFGIVAQGIGLGGGNGGSAFSTAVTLGVPVYTDGSNVSASFNVAMGGSGGGAGGGGESQVFLDSGTILQTQGQGSHGILAQSVGGGGGNGGDSSASSATIDYTRAADQEGGGTYSLSIIVTSGGDASSGASGGIANAVIGDETDSETLASATTTGDYANCVTVQSIGGGGGNAGFGSGNTQTFGTTASLTANIALGSTGGAGGNGGQAVGTTQVNGSIATYGDSSMGMLVQSVGGGGGTSQGGTISLGGNFTVSMKDDPDIAPTGSINFKLGSTGGSGGSGVSASASHDGEINTSGNDSPGILVQSIGGGGGVVGSAGAEASADNPVIVSGLEYARAFVTAYAEGFVPIPFTSRATINVGADVDGIAGEGGYVTLGISGSINTSGDWSQGIVLQSIGAGGGKAGSATYTQSGSVMELDVIVGGSGSSSGNGSIIAITPDGGTITTNGYSAFGLLAQSIGGGGGMAADGSDVASGTVCVGNTDVASGSGGVINLDAGTITITTSGEAAHGVVLQSIGGGGGGGIAGTGNSVGAPSDSAVNTCVGTGQQNSQPAGDINVNNTNLLVTTNDDYAYGLLAQSIGGSGGLASVRGPESSQVGVSTPDNSNPDSGTVSLTFDQNTNIITKGDGAHGVVAQSIAGGGGIGGYTIGGDKLTTTSPIENSNLGSGNANPVTIVFNDEGKINVSGDGAHGIVAQSIGGGGGILPGTDGTTFYGSTQYAGTNASSGSNGRAVTLTINGDVSADGDGATGVLAQSVSCQSVLYTGTGGEIQIVLNGTISTEATIADNALTGIWVDGGNENNVVNISEFGQLWTSQNSIKYTGNATLTINNAGWVNGVVATQNTLWRVGRFNNLPKGTWHTRGFSEVNTYNSGTIRIGCGRAVEALDTASLNGDFEQLDGGRLMIKADFDSLRSDMLTITGDAKLSGDLLPVPLCILPDREVHFANVGGVITGALIIDNSPKNDGSQLFDYDVSQRGNQIYLRTIGNRFTDPAWELSEEQLHVAKYLNSIWEAGANRELGYVFAALDQMTRGSKNSVMYKEFLDELSPTGSYGTVTQELMNKGLSVTKTIGALDSSDHSSFGIQATALTSKQVALLFVERLKGSIDGYNSSN